MTTALLLGDAMCVYKDAQAALKVFGPDIIAACNNIGTTWPHVDHWFSLHPQACADWPGLNEARRRRCLGGLNSPTTWSYKAGPGVDRILEDWGGASGLFAIRGLLELGCELIVLAGVPMTPEEGHFYRKDAWAQGPRYHHAWLKHRDDIAPFVRSMSGWTKELLGAPNPAQGAGLNKETANGQVESSY